MKILFRISIISFLFFSCSNNANNLENLFPNSVKVSLNKIELDQKLFNPTQLFCFDSLLLIDDFKGDNYLFSIYNLQDGRLLKRFCRSGKGPNEIQNKGWVNKISSDSIIIFDKGKSRFYIYSIFQVLNGQDFPLCSYAISGLPDGNSCNNIIALNNKMFVGTGLLEHKRYCLLDSNAIFKEQLIEYPKAGIGNDIPFAKALTFQSSLVVDLAENKFASLSKGLLEIIKFRNEKLQVISRKEYYESDMLYRGKVNVGNKGLIYPQIGISGKSKVGFSPFIKSTNNYLYLMHSDQQFKDLVLNHEKPKFTNVYTVDWNGNSIHHLEFDIPIFSCAVSEDDSLIYSTCIDENNNPVLMYGKLNLNK